MNGENKSRRVVEMELEISERDKRWLVGYMLVFLGGFGVCLVLWTVARMIG